MTAAFLELRTAVALRTVSHLCATEKGARECLRLAAFDHRQVDRPRLVCSWHRDADGRLSCSWEPDIIDHWHD